LIWFQFCLEYVFINSKKTFMKKLLFSCLAFTFFLVGCDKEDNDACPLSQDAIVGTYLVTAARFQPVGGGSDIDILAAAPACKKDDLVVLNDNGTVAFQDAGTVCSPNGTRTATWSLNGNTITIAGDAGTVSQFDCDKMVVTGSDVTGTLTVTYTRQ
jgi:hypothetical protein